MVEVVDYNPAWPEKFEREAAAIRAVLPAECLIAIHHIGSTSVPGLAAKPVIDLMPEVSDLSLLDEWDEAMERIGLTVAGEYGIPGRRFYFKGADSRECNVHAFEEVLTG